jgi:hypothetical protein
MKLFRILIATLYLLPFFARAQEWIPRWNNADVVIHRIVEVPNIFNIELWVRYKNPIYYRKIILYCRSARFSVENEQGHVITNSSPITPSGDAGIYGLYSDLCLR